MLLIFLHCMVPAEWNDPSLSTSLLTAHLLELWLTEASFWEKKRTFYHSVIRFTVGITWLCVPRTEPWIFYQEVVSIGLNSEKTFNGNCPTYYPGFWLSCLDYGLSTNIFKMSLGIPHTIKFKKPRCWALIALDTCMTSDLAEELTATTQNSPPGMLCPE